MTGLVEVRSAQSASTATHGASPAAGAAAVLIGACAFLFRLLAEGRLPNDHYMHLALAQQLLFGDVPGRDFVDPGMPLLYLLSALMQSIWPGPFSEVLLTSAMIGVAAGLTYLVLVEMSGSRLAGVSAAFVEVALQPNLYGYPKVLVPALVIAALCSYGRRPTNGRLALLGVATTVAILLRHDLGLFAIVATIIGLFAGDRSSLRAALATSSRYVLTVALTLTPYLLWVQYSGGIAENIREGLEFSKGDAHQLLWSWARLPAIDWSSPLREENAVAWLFYFSYALVPLAAVLLVLRRRQLQPVVRMAGWAAVTLLACYCPIIMRHPLASRVHDLAAVLAIVGVWYVAQFMTMLVEELPAPRLINAIIATPLVVFFGVSIVSTWRIAAVHDQVEKSRLMDGLPKVGERLRALAVAGTEWPWTWYWPSGDAFRVIPYIAECTKPTDRVLVTWFAPEFYFFSQRGFAAGHSMFSSAAAFAGERDRAKMVARMQSASVPLVLLNEGRRVEFASAYPELLTFIESNYTWSGEFQIRDGSRIMIGVQRDVDVTGSFGPNEWPCHFETAAPGSQSLQHSSGMSRSR